jgi:hypothetical protein
MSQCNARFNEIASTRPFHVYGRGLWLTALPDYFAAKDGITGNGTPTGNLFYAALCFALAMLWVALAGTATVSRDAATPSSRQPA